MNRRILENLIVAVMFEGEGKVKGKAMPFHAWTGPWGLQQVEAPRFQENRHMKAVRLSALRTPPRKYSWYSFLLEGE